MKADKLKSLLFGLGLATGVSGFATHALTENGNDIGKNIMKAGATLAAASVMVPTKKKFAENHADVSTILNVGADSAPVHFDVDTKGNLLRTQKQKGYFLN